MSGESPSVPQGQRQQGLRLLSLDGGGIRGLSELIIIEEMMERIQKRKGIQKPPIPAEVFDLIGGTSTGGLVALLLGRLKLSAAEAISVYENLSEAIFSETKGSGHSELFKASKLEGAIKNAVEAKLGPGCADALMCENGKNEGPECRAFVCAIGSSDMTHAAGPILFRTYDVVENKSDNCKIWEAARATSAAPRIFKRIKIGPPASGIEYVDAGLGYNNPVKQVIDEAERVFGKSSQISCLVSIGTGQTESSKYQKPAKWQKWVPIDLIKVLRDIAVDAGQTAEEMSKRYRDEPGIYYRFSVDRGLGSVALNEWERLGDVRLYTQNYMRLEVVDKSINEAVTVLSGSSLNQAHGLAQLVGTLSTTSLEINIPKRQVSYYVKRSVLQEEVMHRLQSFPSERTVLLGMGGSGKTQLALELCRQAARVLGFVAVIWINASTPASIMQSYVNIANRISGGQWNTKSDKATVEYVQETLRHWERRWLIVFDNFDTPKAFQHQDIEDYIPVGDSASILFTSRHRHSSRLGFCIEVTTMTEQESLDCLLHRLPQDTEEAIQARKIVKVLGHLPLALDQAGAYIRAHEFLVLKDFIPTYRRRKEKLLDEIPEVWEYRKPIDSTDRESGSAIERERKGHFITLASFLDNNAISERYFRVHQAEHLDSWVESCLVHSLAPVEWMEIFLSEGAWDGDKYGAVIAEFRKLSLLQPSPALSEGDISFSLHPVICDWIKFRKTAAIRQQFAVEAVEALAKVVLLPKINYETLEINQQTTLHVNACVRNEDLLAIPSFVGPKPRPSLAYLFSCWYTIQCRWTESRKLAERAVAGWTQLGFQDLLTLKLSANVAKSFASSGELDKAKNLYRMMLTETETLLGPTHPDHCALTFNLITVCAHQEDRKEGMRLLRRIFDAYMAAEGTSYRKPIRILPDLPALESAAEGLAALGYDEPAEGQYKELLSSERHQEYLDSGFDRSSLMQNFARFYRDRQRYDEADKLSGWILTEAKAGEDDQAIVNETVSLANTHIHQRRFEKAEKLLESLILRYSPKNSDLSPLIIAGAMHKLGGLHREQSKLEEAKKLYNQALTIEMDFFGFEHPITSTTSFHLGLVLKEQGLYDQAEEILQRVAAYRNEVLEHGDLDTLYVTRELAELYTKLGKWSKATERYQQVLSCAKEQFGLQHPISVNIMERLLICYSKQGRTVDTQETRLCVLKYYIEQNRLAELHVKQGEWSKAETIWKGRLSFALRNYGSEHPFTIDAMECLDLCYLKLDRLDELEELWQHLFAHYEKRLGSGHPDAIQWIRHLAILSMKRHDWSKAAERCQLWLSALRKQFGSQHPGTLEAMKWLTVCYDFLGQKDEAEKLLGQLRDVLDTLKTNQAAQ